MRNRTHGEIVGIQCYKAARAKWGTGWRNLTRETRQAFISLEVVGVIMSQDRPARVPANYIQEVAQAALAAESAGGVE